MVEVARTLAKSFSPRMDVQVARLQTLHHFDQVDFARGIHAGPDHHMAVGVDGKVAFAPRFDLV